MSSSPPSCDSAGDVSASSAADTGFEEISKELEKQAAAETSCIEKHGFVKTCSETCSDVDAINDNVDTMIDNIDSNLLLQTYEELFKDRYTDLDPEFLSAKQKSKPTPPVIYPWYSRPKRTYDYGRNSGANKRRGDWRDRDEGDRQDSKRFARASGYDRYQRGGGYGGRPYRGEYNRDQRGGGYPHRRGGNQGRSWRGRGEYGRDWR